MRWHARKGQQRCKGKFDSVTLKLTSLILLQRHAFFVNLLPIDWDKLERREVQPPFKPKEGKLTENFDKYFTKAEPTLTPTEPDLVKGIPQDQFNGFSFGTEFAHSKPLAAYLFC